MGTTGSRMHPKDPSAPATDSGTNFATDSVQNTQIENAPAHFEQQYNRNQRAILRASGDSSIPGQNLNRKERRKRDQESQSGDLVKNKTKSNDDTRNQETKTAMKVGDGGEGPVKKKVTFLEDYENQVETIQKLIQEKGEKQSSNEEAMKKKLQEYASEIKEDEKLIGEVQTKLDAKRLLLASTGTREIEEECKKKIDRLVMEKRSLGNLFGILRESMQNHELVSTMRDQIAVIEKFEKVVENSKEVRTKYENEIINPSQATKAKIEELSKFLKVDLEVQQIGGEEQQYKLLLSHLQAYSKNLETTFEKMKSLKKDFVDAIFVGEMSQCLRKRQEEIEKEISVLEGEQKEKMNLRNETEMNSKVVEQAIQVESSRREMLKNISLKVQSLLEETTQVIGATEMEMVNFRERIADRLTDLENGPAMMAAIASILDSSSEFREELQSQFGAQYSCVGGSTNVDYEKRLKRMQGYQKFVAEMMDNDNYKKKRGLLVYHEPGAGKNCEISYTVSRFAESFFEGRSVINKAIVFVPVERMIGEVIEEINTKCGTDIFKDQLKPKQGGDPIVYDAKITNPKYEGKTFYFFIFVYSRTFSTLIQRVESLTRHADKWYKNALICVDEVHNFFWPKELGERNQYVFKNVMTLRQTLLNSKMSENCKILLFTGTPILSSPADLCLLNIVKERDDNDEIVQPFPDDALDGFGICKNGNFIPFYERIFAELKLTKLDDLKRQCSGYKALDYSRKSDDGPGRLSSEDFVQMSLDRNSVFQNIFLENVVIVQEELQLESTDQPDDANHQTILSAENWSRLVRSQFDLDAEEDSSSQYTQQQAKKNPQQSSGKADKNATLTEVDGKYVMGAAKIIAGMCTGFVTYVTTVFDKHKYPSLQLLGDRFIPCNSDYIKFDEKKIAWTYNKYPKLQDVIPPETPDEKMSDDRIHVIEGANKQMAIDFFEDEAYKNGNLSMIRFDRVWVEQSESNYYRLFNSIPYYSTIHSDMRADGIFSSGGSMATMAPSFLRCQSNNNTRRKEQGLNRMTLYNPHFDALWKVGCEITNKRRIVQVDEGNEINGMIGAGIHFCYFDGKTRERSESYFSLRDYFMNRFGKEKIEFVTPEDFQRNGKSAYTSKKPRIAFISLPTGTEVKLFKNDRDQLREFATSGQNKFGEYFFMVVGGADAKEGLSILNGVCVHILTPPLKYSLNQQISRRIFRMCALAGQERYIKELTPDAKRALPPHIQQNISNWNWNLHVQQYVNVPPHISKKHLLTLMRGEYPNVTEYKYLTPEIAVAKSLLPHESLISETYDILQTNAIDCLINNAYHGGAASYIKCASNSSLVPVQRNIASERYTDIMAQLHIASKKLKQQNDATFQTQKPQPAKNKRIDSCSARNLSSYGNILDMVVDYLAHKKYKLLLGLDPSKDDPPFFDNLQHDCIQSKFDVAQVVRTRVHNANKDLVEKMDSNAEKILEKAIAMRVNKRFENDVLQISDTALPESATNYLESRKQKRIDHDASLAKIEEEKQKKEKAQLERENKVKEEQDRKTKEEEEKRAKEEAEKQRLAALSEEAKAKEAAKIEAERKATEERNAKVLELSSVIATSQDPATVAAAKKQLVEMLSSSTNSGWWEVLKNKTKNATFSTVNGIANVASSVKQFYNNNNSGEWDEALFVQSSISFHPQNNKRFAKRFNF